MAIDDVVDWLLDSDPALRWQVERDLVDAPEEVWGATRARVATEGFGARLLALQDPDGQWAGGAFFPADFDFEGPEAAQGAGQPWTATTWSLNSLREWGLDAAVLGGHGRAARREQPLGVRRPAVLGRRGRLLHQRAGRWPTASGSAPTSTGSPTGSSSTGCADGGWNCEWVEGSTRSSFHSTLNSLKGLLYYEAAHRRHGRDAARPAAPGRSTCWSADLFRRLSTGEMVGPWVTRFAYPFRWFYSVLNAADYFRDGVAARRHAARPADGGGDRDDPRRPAAGRHLAPGATAPRSGVVRGRRARGRAVEVAHALRGARVLEWWDAPATGR